MAFLAACVTPAAAQNDGLPAGMKEDFANPPQEAGVRVWWHWMSGNVTKDGIRKDLEWMKRSGIAGFQHFDVGSANYPDMIPNKLGYMSAEWKDAMKYAVRTADSLGLEVAIASSAGWSDTGGPWVKAEDSMKKIAWSTVTVTGGQKVNVELPKPLTTIGTYQDAFRLKGRSWYGDIAVIAVKVRQGDEDAGTLGGVPEASSSDGEFETSWLTDGHYLKSRVLTRNRAGKAWLQYSFDKPVTFRALTLGTQAMRGKYGLDPVGSHFTLQCSDDGKQWKDVCIIPDSNVPSMTVNFPAATARYFRLFMNIPSKWKGRNISEFNLFTLPRVQHSEEKSGFTASYDIHKFPTEDGVPAVAKADVIDITSCVSDNQIVWDAPAGRWRIYRFICNQTGSKNSPAAPDQTGWEIDKLDPEVQTAYYRHYLDTYKRATGGLMGQKGIQYILNDSYEKGPCTWTPAMPSEFKARRGYDLLPWLPVIAGEIIGSAAESEKFLFDWRTTIADLHRASYDNLSNIINEYGLKGRYSESHENGRVFVADGMDVKRNATIPMSAFWMNRNPYNVYSWADLREAASVAHIFGQNIVAAESFTVSGGRGKTTDRAYSYCPENLKGMADFAIAQGLNRFVIHESAHQPSDQLVPGAGLFRFGQWFNRHETWAEYAGLWTGYLSRTCWMLQQGKPVADVLVYYGEDHCITGLYNRWSTRPAVPEGYEFDFINPSGLVGDLKISGGKLIAPSGIGYSVLLLDRNCEIMTVKVLRRLKEIADAGIQICGQVPSRAASLNDNEAEFTALVSDIWHSGRTNVSAATAEGALARAGLQRDFYTGAGDISYLHRRLSDGTDIYWVSNHSGKAQKVRMLLRSGHGYATMMDPVAVTCKAVPVARTGDFASVEADFGVDDALFFVLTANGSAAKAGKEIRTGILAIEGPWDVRFQKGRASVDKTTLKALVPLNEIMDKDIRYFSGKATYSTVFKMQKGALKPGVKAILSLGTVKNIAEVRINGKKAGVVWRAPFEVDVTPYIKGGKNTLEVDVTNLWTNRVIGDRRQDGGKKYTWTPREFYTPDSQLIPSGLIGPVNLVGCVTE